MNSISCTWLLSREMGTLEKCPWKSHNDLLLSFGTTSTCAQVLFLTLSSGMTPDRAWETIWYTRVWSQVDHCKANFTHLLSLQPLKPFKSCKIWNIINVLYLRHISLYFKCLIFNIRVHYANIEDFNTLICFS